MWNWGLIRVPGGGGLKVRGGAVVRERIVFIS